MSSELLVQVETEGRVAIVSIARARANVLNTATVDMLEMTLRRVLADPDINVVILTGKGMLFSAGADIRELAALDDPPAAEAFSRKGQALCDLIESASKPIIAAINGPFCLGGGNELALACHLRLAEESTQLGQPEAHLGLTVGWGGSQRLLRLVGPSKALELLLTGKRIQAREAERIGLVNRVVGDGTVREEALTLAYELAALSGPVLAATLQMVRVGLREGWQRGLAEETYHFGQLCTHEDWHEGTRAFLEKRKPIFHDR